MEVVLSEFGNLSVLMRVWFLEATAARYESSIEAAYGGSSGRLSRYESSIDEAMEPLQWLPRY
jgi:hypothetical protein